MAYARSKKKVAMSQATQATQASASARLSRATARETQAKANITSQVETTCQSAHIELRHYGPSVSTSTCCEESGRFCAGCARATSDGAACRECAGGFIEREGNCIACADSAGWTNLAGKTCPQLAAADCNDIKVRGKSSNEAWGAPKVLACCTCGGGIISPTPFFYPSVHLVLGSSVRVLPSVRTAPRYSLNEDCEFPDYGLQMDGATGIISRPTGSLYPRRVESFSVECTVTAHQAPGLTYDTPVKIAMDFLNYGAPVLFFEGVKAPQPTVASKAPGEWKDFEVQCAPVVDWLQVDSTTGDLRLTSGTAGGSVDTEDATLAGQHGGICVVKALHKALASDSPAGLQCQYYYGTLTCHVPDLSQKTPGNSVVVPQIDFYNNFPEAQQTSLFCIRCTGYLVITLPGYYQFTQSSDDGAVTYLNGQMIISKPKCGFWAKTSSSHFLHSGTHQLEVAMCEGGGSEIWKLEYQGPDTNGSKITVPESALQQHDEVPL
ncbi:unnamed protein product [Symbiodinium natans]|uniref:PA14 domain-containing protein n=1 Tax=Symbiodinium natans TaxID=878477 RepID=A0A812UHT1_9DINO|nr:unnamed protein product [Symbiodinium natans]